MIAVLLIATAVVLILLRRRSAREARRQGWKPKPDLVPQSVQVPPPAKPRRLRSTEPASARDIDITQSCDDLKESLQVLAGKYSLDAFTIATADGLVFASTGSVTAQADAAYYNRYTEGKDPAGMTIFGLKHKGSDLTAIIRSSSELSPDVRKRIENDTKDILNWWI